MKKRNNLGIFIQVLKNKNCKKCGKDFLPKNSLQNLCSARCYWDSRKGLISKKRNGKNISCKFCKKQFYIPASRIDFKKYCSRKCGLDDNWGFKNKTKQCKICGNNFVINSQLKERYKTCSKECWKLNSYTISKIRSSIKIQKKCKICESNFIGLKFHIGTTKCKTCLFKEMSENRKGKKNPYYKDGHAIGRGKGIKSNIYTGKHFRACLKYRKDFLKKNEYLFCEVCNISNALRYEVHHLYYASRYPKHPELHNFKNLIMLCIQCHNNFHSGKYKGQFEQLEQARGLKKLFENHFKSSIIK